MVVVGAGILWFGWFGFNAGDGLQANGVAAQALVNTQVAAAAAMLVWLVVERIKDGHATVLGGVTGAVGGAGDDHPGGGLRQHDLGRCSSARSPASCATSRSDSRRSSSTTTRSTSSRCTSSAASSGRCSSGFFGEQAINSIGADGVFFGGGFGLLGEQVLALASVIAFSFVVTWLIAMAIEHTIGLRVAPEDEEHLDEVQQGMRAYDGSPVRPQRRRPQAPALRRLALDPDGRRTDLRLVSAVVDAWAMDGNAAHRLAAERGSAARSSAPTPTSTDASPDSQVVRGERRQRPRRRHGPAWRS